MPRKKTAKAKKIQIGNKLLTCGKQLGDMIDSNDMYDKKDFVGLRRKLEEEGYLFIRGVIPKEIICKARNLILKQAAAEKSIVINESSSLNDAKMFRKGSSYPDGYCIDGVTGSETNERNNINISAWQQIGPSQICQAVYNGKYIQTFWKLLFGKKSTKPLVKQTFLRLMGNSGTIQHADYYYFKRDTHIFSGNDGINAQNAAKQYLQSHNMWKPEIYEVKQAQDEKAKENDLELECNICLNKYFLSELDFCRQERLNKSLKRKNDFGMEGCWHCPSCAAAPLSIYTTWISLSQLSTPRDSILAMVPKSHLLSKWDLPQNNAQLPGDFNWKLKWVIPKYVGYGDIVIFNIKTVHASSLNKSSPRSFRCSCDTRLQLLPCTPIKSKKNEQHNVVPPSPHPGLKLKKIIDDSEDEDDINIMTLTD